MYRRQRSSGLKRQFGIRQLCKHHCLALHKQALNEDKQKGGGGTLRTGTELGTPKASFSCDSGHPSPLRSDAAELPAPPADIKAVIQECTPGVR